MGSLYLPESEAKVNGSCNPIDHLGGVLSFTTTSGKVESDKKKAVTGASEVSWIWFRIQQQS